MIENVNFILNFIKIKKIILLAVLIIVAVFLELLSIALILPVFALIMGDNSIQIPIISDLISKTSQYEFFNYAPNLLFIILFFYVLKTLYLFFVTFFQSKISLDIQISFADKLLDLYQKQNFLRYLDSNSSEQIRNIYSEVPVFVKYLILPSILIFTEIFVSITILSFISFINFKFLFLSMILLVFSGFIYFLIFGKKLKKWGDNRLRNDKKRIEYLQYNFFGHKELLLNNKNDLLKKKYKEYNYISGINNLYSSVLAQFPRYFLELILIILVISFILISLVQDTSLVNLIPILSVFFGAFYRLMPSFNRIYQSIQNIKFGYPVFKKIKEEFIETKNVKINDELITFNKEIKLKDINFNYNKKKILRNIFLDIKKGECIVITGHSGSGKSTLINLITGMLSPNSGEILIDGVKKKLRNKNWFNIVSHIPQSTFMLNDTIKSNIKFDFEVKSTNDDEEITDILEKVKLKEFLNKQPNGLNTLIGDYGAKISGGEKQRISLARALYKKSEILIFDEATSSLDRENEIFILDFIKSLKGKKTIILISHNPKLINFSDKIFNLDGGYISEEI
jgi:ABC-type multidrug transport system fused ATPase/permease subunit